MYNIIGFNNIIELLMCIIFLNLIFRVIIIIYLKLQLTVLPLNYYSIILTKKEHVLILATIYLCVYVYMYVFNLEYVSFHLITFNFGANHSLIMCLHMYAHTYVCV